MVVSEDAPAVVETVERVRLRKSLDEDEYDIPALRFEIESDRKEPVQVTVREDIPDSVSIEDVGFHRQMGADYWEVDGDELVFEYELSAGEAFTTIYAIRTETTLLTDDLLTEPNALEVEAVGGEVPEATPMTRSGAESPYPAEPATPGDEAEDETPTAGGVDLDPELTEDGGDAEATEASLADRLATEIEAGDVSPDSLETLQEALLEEADADGAVDARLGQLQRDVGDLRAYKNALEAFLEDEGSAQEIIDSFDERLDEVESELESVRASLESLESRSDSHESELRTMDADLESLASEHEELAGEFNALAADLDAIDDRVPQYPVDERIDELEAQIESIGEFVDNLKTAFE